MSKFYFKNAVREFIENEFFIQKSIPDHEVATEMLFFLYQNWLKENQSFATYWEKIKDHPLLSIKPNFFEKAETTNSFESDNQFVHKIIVMSFEAVFKVCSDFDEVYQKHNQESLGAVDEDGIDVSIEKAFIELSQKYQEEFFKKIKSTKFLNEFKFFKTSFLDFFKIPFMKKDVDQRHDSSYILIELLSGMIDSIDDIEINLDESEFDSANNNLELFIFHELLFDRLILLAEHTEYQFLNANSSLEQFKKVNIIERYDEIAMLKHLKANNEENDIS